MPIDKVQKFLVQVDSLKLLEQYLKVAITTVLDSNEELAVKVVNRKEKYLSLHIPPAVSDQKKSFPVIFISGWYLPKNENENSYFNRYPSWQTFRSGEIFSAIDSTTDCIVGLLIAHGERWGKEFKKKFGDGYNSGFNRYDGSIGLGYEIRCCDCFPEWLAISITHMYYGK